MVQDFLLDENGDLRIANGDFVIGDSENQEIEALLVSMKGEFKEFPSVGADFQKLLKSRSGQTAALKEIKLQLRNDGFDVSNIEIDNESIEVNATRTT
ncbi:hypothetical protein QWY81_17930 [Polaribacter undariae]|uniref:Oxidase n=1 Tax=Polaribacter sejongensis TaxID=985043 RepID=A0AAJ1R020_9FLAO|nr:hypothetical protein [Polaribacter undariae]MDN3621352.1 hypothetical protein [Polaribacter undariae]UWD31894.1 hypothetical protein NQP51_17395 [Polaribacter undariae]